MITVFDSHGTALPLTTTPQALPADAVWVDLFGPTPDERTLVESLTGLPLPSSERMAEVESSSRLSSHDDVLVLAAPVLFRRDAHVVTTPLAFVLSPRLLVSIRSEDLKAFQDYRLHCPAQNHGKPKGSADVFLGLLEAIIDRMADGIESVGADLDKVSRDIFGTHADTKARMQPSRAEAGLHAILQLVGRSGDTTSHARDSLLGLGRLLAYVTNHLEQELQVDSKERLETLKRDVASLNDYETRLTDKVQFLLDSTLGFINILQNRTFKLLTVASVIGIPPTFVVGLYGMNFKNMPEYDWSYGYQWGLLLVAASVVAPIVWLKLRGWL